MIQEISVKNYKSIVALNMPLGRFNLLIGANGCGKSNILESIALAAAASANKLDREYFDNRGIRFVEPKFMFPAFDDIEANEIEIVVKEDAKQDLHFNIFYNETVKPPRWDGGSITLEQIMNKINSASENKTEKIKEPSRLKKKKEQKKAVDDFYNILEKYKVPDEVRKEILNIRLIVGKYGPTVISPKQILQQYQIFSLEESRLRTIDNDKYIYPLGHRGEGLLPYLKELSQRDNGAEIIKEINENLKLLDWFDELTIPSGQLSSEVSVRLHDNYLRESLEYFDQRSTNEGFLYLLFYLTLIISDETPSFFAIENIDASFNPKLCKEVVRRLIQLAKKHNKQIIATTHNPAVLDALDLEDQDVKLHVVRRSVDGYTKINSVELKSKLNMPLSKAWTDGLLGGLPDNF